MSFPLRACFLPSALLLAALAGCYTGSAVDTNRSPAPATAVNGTEPKEHTKDDGSTSISFAEATGLPCDVAALIASCASCHGETKSGGAPNRITSYDDLTAPSESDPEKTVAELSLSRMKSMKRPMPPTGKLALDRIEAFEKWVSDGMPKGTCGAAKPAMRPGTDDAGIDPDAGTEPPPMVESVCTSGIMAAQDAPASGEMKPGKACIACHTRFDGPTFEVGGTVYPTLHEPSDCSGVSEGVKVLIIDANGSMRSLSVNAAGNFYSKTPLPKPYRAMVVRGNEVREMKTTQTSGDCNGCHTEFGKGAPGRIMTP